ncbi:MAG: acetyl-CoA C-acetyltransferase [Bdellovibrio sp.]|nr:acetyl-CoA C-acetyltransferase [Bdellovibrio sp.]
MNKIAIIGGTRIPFARSVSAYKEVGNFELLTATLKSLKEKYKLDSYSIGEVCAGAVLKRSKDFSLAREALLEAGLSPQTPGIDIQKACGTSLEAAFIIGAKIATGQIECGIAAGTDTSSDVPIELSVGLSRKLVMASKERDFLGKARTLAQLSPKDILPKIPAVKEPRTGLTMGEHCELMAQEWKISRKDQDELAYQSHRRAAAAYESGFFRDLVVPFLGLEKDNNLRPDTTVAALAKLRPCFDKSDKGTLTAGNSTPLTDGASAIFMCSEDFAHKHGLEIECFLTYCESKAVDYRKDEGLLMAPAYTVPAMLERAKLKLQDFDFYEIHEAFAAQVLCTLKAWQDPKFCKEKLKLPNVLGEIDRDKLNVKGGSIALGHPFGATGTRLIATASKLLREKGQGRALLSICTAGGMGVTAILERS